MATSDMALELVAFFGFLCILLNILLPVLAFVLRFVVVDVPSEWRKWQLHRSQQRELRRLQRRVDVLTRRKLAEELETRRRARTASAHKRRQAETTPQQTPTIFDLLPESQPRTNGVKSSSKKAPASTPQHSAIDLAFTPPPRNLLTACEERGTTKSISGSKHAAKI